METQLVSVPFSLNSFRTKGGSGVVDNMLDYQSRDREIDPRFSDLSDETLNRDPVPVWPHRCWDVKPEFIHSLLSYSENCPSAVISSCYFLPQVLSLKMF